MIKKIIAGIGILASAGAIGITSAGSAAAYPAPNPAYGYLYPAFDRKMGNIAPYSRDFVRASGSEWCLSSWMGTAKADARIRQIFYPRNGSMVFRVKVAADSTLC